MKTEKLVIIKNIKLANKDMLIILIAVCFLDKIKPSETISRKLTYTDSIGWKPNIKSENSRMIVGNIKAKRLSKKNVPENNAIAPIAVILGGWGITLVNTPSNTKKATNRFLLLVILYILIIQMYKKYLIENL